MERIRSEKNFDRRNDPANFLKLVEKYNKNLRATPKDSREKNVGLELEVKISSNGRSLLSRTDYDNVVKKLKSIGYKCQGDPSGVMLLRMSPEEINGRTGKIQISNVRAELTGVESIQEYCKTNDLQKLFDGNHLAKLVEKSNWVKGVRSDSVINNDFNFKMDLRSEINISTDYGKGMNILEKWKDVKKTFRLINRVTFTQPFSSGNKNPCRIDLSIIKKQYNPSYTIQQSNVFHLPESFEFEIEVRNYLVIQESFQPLDIQRYIKKSIQDVSAGIQNSDFPISNSEQKEVLKEYYNIITKGEKGEKDEKEYKMFNTLNFIGPSSVTLHLKHIIEPNENDAVPNIRVDYTVTEKTDGERYLMFIPKSQRIYFINSRMNVIFTGCIMTDDEFVDSIIDGEYVANDKNMNPIQSFYAFDIYFISGKDCRHIPFYSLDYAENKEKYQYEFRHSFLSEIFKIMKTNSVVEGEPCPTQFFMKTFYPQNRDQTIFDCCYQIKRKEEGGGFIYEIDGLIFTPMRLGVGEEKLDGPIPTKKSTWWWSLKWKPEKYNSIDFLVTTKKSEGGEDLLTPIFQDGKNMETNNQLQFYKTIVLRCGYNEKNHGYLNPCQSLLDDKVPKNTGESDYKPVQFYPTEPSDSNAGIVNILTTKDSKGMYVMKTTENEDLVQDNTVVEFYYDKSRPEGWRWIPLRVRYDKTSEYRTTGRKFGNDYSIANDNWHSIHHPVTEQMIFHGMDIPTSLEVDESVYYNTTLRNNLQSMRDFHNLYVKKTLIASVSKKGYNLIDYACGKAGDLPKWMYCNLSFVFGIDISKDNLENRKNGCCARYLNEKARHHKILGALFVNGNSAENIKSGEAMLDAKSKLITKAVFGEIQDKGLDGMVHRYFGVGRDGFDISSCQFATHYFFRNKSTLHNFLRNVSECTRIGGHFIGTCYDGRQIFNELRDRDMDGSVSIYDKSNVKIWSIVKKYDEEEFLDDETSLGYEILVYQESINKFIPEFLVNFEYLKQIMIFYGFSLITKEEANEVGLPDGSDMFRQLYSDMLDKREGKRMNENEKKISFLNRYFVFRKNVNVNAKQVAESFIRNERVDEIFASEVKFGPDIEKESQLEPVDFQEPIGELELKINPKTKPKTKSKFKILADETLPIEKEVRIELKESNDEPSGEPTGEPTDEPTGEPIEVKEESKEELKEEPKPKKTKAREKRETGKTKKIKIIE